MDTVALTRIGFYVFVAAAVIFLVEALYLALAAPIGRKRSVNRRMRALDEGFAGEQVLVRIKAQRGIFDKDFQLMGGLSKLLIQSGLRLTFGRFVVLTTLLFLLILLGLQLLTALPTWACFIVALILGAAIPLQVVRFTRTRRQAAFTQQLPDALDVVVRSLRSGHPVPTAMGLVGREMTDPIGSEFGITIDEMTYGLDLPRALVNLAERVGVADLSLLVTAVSIQSGTGGNLSEVLQNLSKVLRDRFQLRRKVRALSAEGRFSAYGLFILPILIFLAIYLQNPKYYTDAWQNPMFKLSIVGLCFWSLLGDYIMYKMINFKF
jgi:tight adherence protein B